MVNLQHIYEVFATCIPYIAFEYYFNWMKGLQIHQIIEIDQGGTWLQRKFSELDRDS